MEILTNVRIQNVTITLTLLFNLMTCRDSKCMYLWIQLCCELTVINQLHQLCSSLPTAYSVFVNCCSCCSFIGLESNWSHSLCIFQVFLSLLQYSYSHSHFTLFLPTITCSPSEVLIMINRNTKYCPVLSHISPVTFAFLKAQCHLLEHSKPTHFAHAVYCWIRMSYRFSQISRSRTLESIFNINCVFGPKSFWNTRNKNVQWPLNA